MADPEDRAGALARDELRGSRAGDGGAEEQRDAAEEEVPARSPSRRRRRWLWIAGAVVVCAASVGGGFVWRTRRAETNIEADRTPPAYRFTFPYDAASRGRWFDATDDTPPKFNPPRGVNSHGLPRSIDEAAKMFVRATDAKYRAVYEKSHWSDYRFIWAASKRHGPAQFEGLALETWLELHWLGPGAPLTAEFRRHGVYEMGEMVRVLVLRILAEITRFPFQWEWALATAQDGLWVRQTTLPDGSRELFVLVTPVR